MLLSKYTKVNRFYGKEKQSGIAMEECAGLIQAINKCLLYPQDKKRRENLIEEISDVMICVDWLREMYSITDDELLKTKTKKELKIMERYAEDVTKSRYDANKENYSKNGKS